MTTLVVKTPEGVSLRREIAGPGSRFAAGLLDALLIGSGYLVVALFVVLAAQLDVTGLSKLAGGLLIGGLPLTVLGYLLLFQLVWRGETPGKRVLGLVVASADGYPASAMQITMRTLLLPVDVSFPIPISIGILVMLLTEKRQRLGDLAGGTVVVRRARENAVAEPFPGERWSRLEDRALPLLPGMAARLTGDDYEFLRDLWARPGLSPEERRRLFVAAARHFSKELGLGPFQDARVVLKELYLFLRESREEGSFRANG